MLKRLYISLKRFYIWLKIKTKKGYRRTSGYLHKNRISISITLLIVLFLVVLFSPRIFITVDAGVRGVMYRPLVNGVRLDTLYNEGLHVISPWNTITHYESRIQKRKFNIDVLSDDGMYIDVEAVIQFRPDTSRIALLHEHVGPDYINRVVVPVVIENTRQIFGRYSHQQIYGQGEFIKNSIVRESTYDLITHYISLVDIPFNYIRLPLKVSDAIENKLKEEQIVEEYDFRIQIAEKEAQRKRVEATGIRDFQQTITDGITPQYLIYKGIDATLDLAKSNNSKVVVIGNSQNGLPLILDTKSNNDINSWIGAIDSTKPGNFNTRLPNSNDLSLPNPKTLTADSANTLNGGKSSLLTNKDNK